MQPVETACPEDAATNVSIEGYDWRCVLIFLHGDHESTRHLETILEELRERFGIQAGVQVDFAAAEDGIRLREVVDRGKQVGVLGCLKDELAGHRARGDFVSQQVPPFKTKRWGHRS